MTLNHMYNYIRSQYINIFSLHNHKLLGIILQGFMFPDLHSINLQDSSILIMKIMKHSVLSNSLLLSRIFGMKSI